MPRCLYLQFACNCIADPWTRTPPTAAPSRINWAEKGCCQLPFSGSYLSLPNFHCFQAHTYALGTRYYTLSPLSLCCRSVSPEISTHGGGEYRRADIQDRAAAPAKGQTNSSETGPSVVNSRAARTSHQSSRPVRGYCVLTVDPSMSFSDEKQFIMKYLEAAYTGKGIAW